MADLMLREIINGRDVQRMKCSEASRIVREFYLRWELATLGCRNPQRADRLAQKALNRAGLGYFA